MKTLLFFIVIIVLSVFAVLNSHAQIIVTGCTGTGNGTYSSLTNICGAFQSINSGIQTGANITITITGDVVSEAGTISLNAGKWTSLTIIPSGARLISGTVSGGPLIYLYGADYVRIDGLNTGGNSLTISNSSTSSGSGTSTIKFVADAGNNTITNCTILGSATGTLGTNAGNIFISTAATSGSGNDNITISNCNIGPAGDNFPSKLIYGSGSTSSANIANSNISINNCNLYDFFLSSGCAAVYADGGNTDWSVTNNRIYQTASRTFTSAGTMTGVYFSNSTYGNNIQISGNIIGYSSPNATGTLTLSGGCYTAQFQGIYLYSMPAAANDCNINNNIVSDISLSSSSAAFTFYGIYNASSASTNTININNNQIKNVTTLSASGYNEGIYAGTAYVLNCNGNTIDNITRDAAGFLCGIQYHTPGTVTFNGNSISNLITTSTTSTNGVYGIYSGNAAVNEYIIGNSVFNLASSSTASQYIYCIASGTGSSGKKIIHNNNVYNITGGGYTIHGI